MHDVKTKFHSYVSFSITGFDTTPDADNDDGEVEIPSVCLDGDFTIEDLMAITVKMESLLAGKSYFEGIAKHSRFPLVSLTEKG